MKSSISKIPKFIFGAMLFLVFANAAQATHNRAGEITFEQLNNLTFKITITTYTKASSVQADRDSLELCFGDGSPCRWIQRDVLNGTLLGNDIKLNTYTTFHSFPGPGEYKLSMTDPNRNGGILNVNPPYSDQVPFHLETTLRVLNPIFSGFNSSPILTNPPIDEGCLNQVFEHNAGAYDPDGDSLAYELTVPLQGLNNAVTNYIYPNNIGGGLQTFTLNPITGTIIWSTPQQAGEYNVAFLIKEYRNGVLIAQTMRDMQITIESCNNRPPVINTIDELCIIAGDTIQFNVTATDPDNGQLVTLTAVGGPVLTDGSFFAPASFTVISNPANPVGGVFEWVTRCEHVQEQYYQILFKAEDNYTLPGGNPQSLVDYKTVRIKIVGPPPENTAADVQNGQVEITWDGGYLCKDAPNFFGFSVWRREGSNPFIPDTCAPSLAGKGYTKIANEIMDVDANGQFFYIDDNVDRGRFYCYRIVGDFAEFTPSGVPYNLAEGLPSEEICVQMSRDLPLITNVSVDVTGTGNGEMFVRWSKPDPQDLDTLQNTGPYEYRLYRSEGLTGDNPQLIYTATSPTFWEAVDTSFLDAGLNTATTPYSYKVEFFSGGNSLGETSVASQVYLTITGTDEKNILSWAENIPWEHFEYTIYKRNNNTGNFDSIAVTTETSYEDENLQNGTEYCYYVRGIGSYNIPGVVDPIVNFSQEACGIPVDSVPPCPPVMSVLNRCNTPTFQGEDFENQVSWTNPNNSCATDVARYNVYYSETTTSDFLYLSTNEGASNTVFNHLLNNTLAGCYYVTALDSVGNESEPSNVICVDNCPDYSLPNVFTPNGDNVNDLYIPFPYAFISRIDMTIVDRWGTVVFRTVDPEINWDGTNLQGQPVAEGVYYYKCVVFENRVGGEVRNANILSGYIQVIRGN